MRASACLMALVVAAAPLSALAQTSGGGGGGGGAGGGSSGSGSSGGGGGAPTNASRGSGAGPQFDMLYMVQAEMFRQNLTRLAKDANLRVMADRAIRVGAIVRTGDCAQAEALAQGEGDAEMAERVTKLCVPGKGWSAEARRMAQR